MGIIYSFLFLFSGQNIGLRQQTLQSATLWGYNPELAVDNNADTCSFTPKTADQRWWQV